MKQSPGVMLSAAGQSLQQSLGLRGTIGNVVSNETEEERKKRLAAVAAARAKIGAALSPAGRSLLPGLGA